MRRRLAILGAGNMGMSLANGLIKANKYIPQDVTLTRPTLALLAQMKAAGFDVTTDNAAAVAKSDMVVLAVLPQQLDRVLDEIKSVADEKKHVFVSLVSGVQTKDVQKRLGKKVETVRVMPNTAIAIGQSMTCVASSVAKPENMQQVISLFQTVGEAIEIHEELITAATALNACGIAFFLRAIRAASQGGVEIGFHAEDALKMATQTAKGAAMLLQANNSHPETEIDKVTSPRGCTIAGLNEMEHEGFSSAVITGIRLAHMKAGGLYTAGKTK